MLRTVPLGILASKTKVANKSSIVARGHAMSLFLVISYLLCVLFDLMIPGMAMYEAWAPLLPGFSWITWPSFFLGLVETYAWGWYIAGLYGFLFSRFARHSN